MIREGRLLRAKVWGMPPGRSYSFNLPISPSHITLVYKNTSFMFSYLYIQVLINKINMRSQIKWIAAQNLIRTIEQERKKVQ